MACVNSPDSTTISGDDAAIDELKTILDQQGVFNRKLKVDSAYHSHHMKKVADQYQKSLGHITTADTRRDVAFFSSVTGAKKTSSFGPTYWTQNLVSKVRFSDAVKLISADMIASKRSGAFSEHLRRDWTSFGIIRTLETVSCKYQPEVLVYLCFITRQKRHANCLSTSRPTI